MILNCCYLISLIATIYYLEIFYTLHQAITKEMKNNSTKMMFFYFSIANKIKLNYRNVR